MRSHLTRSQLAFVQASPCLSPCPSGSYPPEGPAQAPSTPPPPAPPSTAGPAPHRDKLARLARAVDKIRDKYGGGAISLASTVRGEAGSGQRQDDVPPVD